MTSLARGELALPVAVFGSAMLLAWVVHRDLRELVAAVKETGPRATAGLPTLPTAPAVPGAPAVPAVAPAASPDLMLRDAEIRARENAQNALASQRSLYSKACPPRDASTGKHAVPMMLSVEFDAAGKEARRSVRPFLPPPFGLTDLDRRVQDCVLHGNVPKLTIEPLGRPLAAELSLDFD